MKKLGLLGLFLGLCCLLSNAVAQDNNVSAKRESRKNLVVKEWNTEGKNRFLDHITVYNDQGLKIEEIEYTQYGQKERVTSEYNALGVCIKQVVYDDRNRITRIRKFEYNEDGSKKMQYNYLPNGKLYSSKSFEYIYTESK
ncbi:MAG: hypothetical protein AB7C90_04470 [Bacteroidales bacterium]